MQDDPEKGGLGLVAAVDRVLEELQANGMAWRMRIRPCQVGVDPSNRDGVGVNVEDVHSLGADILYWGWSWSQVASAVCVEEAPGSHAIANFNRDLAAGCDALPGDGLDQVRFGSLACSHTNTVCGLGREADERGRKGQHVLEHHEGLDRRCRRGPGRAHQVNADLGP